MIESTKIDFRHRRIQEIDDITDLVAILFPGNRNQQHAAARMLMLLKSSTDPVASLAPLETQYGISRRTLQRTRAKLARLGLIEHVGWMGTRSAGTVEWRVSSRMSSSLRLLAQKIDDWRGDERRERRMKDERLVGLLESRYAASDRR